MFTIQQLGAAEIRANEPTLIQIAAASAYNVRFVDIPILFVAYCGREAVAFAGLAKHHDVWCLRACVVLPKYYGRGLQRTLISRRLEYLAQQKAPFVDVSVRLDNTTSIKNLRAFGFEFIDGTKIFDGVVHHKMRKLLAS
jgi:ribosomal protein S18 acetylase RimI-like enzyme